MIVDAQREAIAFLASPATHGGGAVERMETHISEIFLSGGHVFKLKRAVRLPYVDFSTPALRLAACEAEVKLNAPTAPGLYRGVRRLTRKADGRLELDGRGEVVDAVIEMTRFDQAMLFDRLAEAGALTPDLMNRLVGRILKFHQSAPISRRMTGSAGIANVLAINHAGFATSHLFAEAELAILENSFRAELGRHAVLLDRRAENGLVRRCHGDLHLRNICLIDNEPCLFDCIEFNEDIAICDVLYDLAFLLMDLVHRGQTGLANRVANRYFDEAGQAPDVEASFALLPFFMAIRAAVRAHVLATQAEEAGGDAALEAEARRYFGLAGALLARRPPILVGIGGLSGSGKSTIADRLAPFLGVAPGARIVESDRVRKALFGVSAETHLPSHAYHPDVSERVYAEMRVHAAMHLAAGTSVVADAVFDRVGDRAALEQAVRPTGLPFFGFWLALPPEVLRARVAARRGGASDATLEVLESQLARHVGCTDWVHVDAGTAPERIVADIRSAIASATSGEAQS